MSRRKTARNNLIIQMRESTEMTYKEIGLEFRISKQAVERIIRREAKDEH